MPEPVRFCEGFRSRHGWFASTQPLTVPLPSDVDRRRSYQGQDRASLLRDAIARKAAPANEAP